MGTGKKEITSPIRLNLRRAGVWPQEPGVCLKPYKAVEPLHTCPARSICLVDAAVTLRNATVAPFKGMKFPDATYTLKMACGETEAGLWR